MNESITDKLKAIDVNDKNLFISTLLSLSDITIVTPLIPKPSKAMLIIINAKWYHNETERTLIKVNSSINVLNETSNIPILCLTEILSISKNLFVDFIKYQY